MNNEQIINHEKNKKLPYTLQTDIWETIYIEGLWSAKWNGLGKLLIIFNDCWDTIYHNDTTSKSESIKESKRIIKHLDKEGL